MDLRKRPVHHPFVNQGNRSNWIFVTVCTKGRKALLDRAEVHRLILEVWSDESTWLVGDYLMMPDHIHFFCTPQRMNHSVLKSWMCYWKSTVSRRWPFPEEKPVWQRDYWDTQLRSGRHFTEKWHYVRNNPVRAQLVKESDEWPYQGKVHPLIWHD